MANKRELELDQAATIKRLEEKIDLLIEALLTEEE